MNPFDSELQERLASLSAQGLRRQLRPVNSSQGPRIVLNSETLLNFSSNDYLGLASHPALQEAAIAAVREYGAGAGASRLICGSLKPYHELEETLAQFKATEAALSFSSGYSAALGTICALMGSGDIIILDKLVHASVVDAARLSGARLRVFKHNNLEHLEALLRWAREGRPHTAEPGPNRRPRALVVTESVFSMDGDCAPLRGIVELKSKYDAWLMLDEAHATGLYGARRRGLAEEQGIQAGIEIQMGTLGKAIGAAGGYICGSRALIDYLVNRARSFVFSTAPVPAAAAAATAGLRLLQTDEGEQRRRDLWRRVAQFQAGRAQGSGRPVSAIIPIPVGPEEQAVAAAEALRRRGVFIPAVRYPTVARGQARLRLTLSAAHEQSDVGQVLAALEAVQLHPVTQA